MTDDRLRPCPTKGCPWRGPDPDDCPMHGADDVMWDRERMLQPDDVASRQRTRHRS